MTNTQSDNKTLADLTAFNWTPQPEAARLVQTLLDECLRDCPYAAGLSQRMLDNTGTRLLDWLAILGLPANHPAARQLSNVGYQLGGHLGSADWEHPAGMLPDIRILTGQARLMAIKVESVVDFLVAQRTLEKGAGTDCRNGPPGAAHNRCLTPFPNMTAIEILGHPHASVRAAKVAGENGVECWIVERHGARAVDPEPSEIVPLHALTRHAEAFRLRRRDFETDEAGFAEATRLVESAIADLGRDRACDLFFFAEREYWMRRNRAGRIQKARQDALGLGWANHDHHTYRSSRHCFSLLIAFLERLGFVCRERFYAGREAGWGAQVIEHPVTGVTIFADVDLSPEELTHDFSHEPLPPRNELGTVGLWCALHGEAFLQAGMHHLECQFDFSTTRDQLQQAGIETMPPFTDYPYLKQAFTQGEIWPVDPRRVDRLLEARRISPQQAQQFLTQGALGSHLEILQRNDGYKGFNQAGINQIIAATDPRRANI